MTDDEWDSMPSNTDYDDRDEAVNSIAASTINFLETGGFNFESEKDIIGLLSFLEVGLLYMHHPGASNEVTMIR